MSLTPRITELRGELDELKNPTDRPPASLPIQSVQLVDRSRLLAAWESNIKTMQGVLDRLEDTQRANTLTRIMVLLTVLLNLVLFVFMVAQLSKITALVHHVDQTVGQQRRIDTVIEKVVIEQQEQQVQQQQEAEERLGPLR